MFFAIAWLRSHANCYLGQSWPVPTTIHHSPVLVSSPGEPGPRHTIGHETARSKANGVGIFRGIQRLLILATFSPVSEIFWMYGLEEDVPKQRLLFLPGSINYILTLNGLQPVPCRPSTSHSLRPCPLLMIFSNASLYYQHANATAHTHYGTSHQSDIQSKCKITSIERDIM